MGSIYIMAMGIATLAILCIPIIMLTPNVAQPRILVMSMVKNEEQIINRMFGRFDVMICDTGSTDDTIQVSMNQSVHIFKSPVGWINFEYNRNECLQATRTYMLSHPEYTHVLLMDADHVISMQTESPIEYDVNIIQIHGDVHMSYRIYYLEMLC